MVRFGHYSTTKKLGRELTKSCVPSACLVCSVYISVYFPKSCRDRISSCLPVPFSMDRTASVLASPCVPAAGSWFRFGTSRLGDSILRCDVMEKNRNSLINFLARFFSPGSMSLRLCPQLSLLSIKLHLLRG